MAGAVGLLAEAKAERVPTVWLELGEAKRGQYLRDALGEWENSVKMGDSYGQKMGSGFGQMEA